MAQAQSGFTRNLVPRRSANVHRIFSTICAGHNTLIRRHASQTSLGASPSQQPPRHKRVTILNDDGRVAWGQLSAAEKVARTTQQSVNLSIILIGAAATAGVAFFLYTDVFASDSPTRLFDRAVDRIKFDPHCTELLGSSEKITAYGSGYWSTWSRHRPLQHRIETDKMGTQRLYMHWNMQGPNNNGTVQLYMLKREGESEFSYGHLALDVKGYPRVYLENAGESLKKRTPGTFLGIRWTR